jgi:hypothetical protein
LVLLLLARVCRTWRGALHLVQPDTLLRWHRDLLKIVWRRKSRRKGQPRRLPQETIERIQRMARDNPLYVKLAEMRTREDVVAQHLEVGGILTARATSHFT